ncbi:MAG TPA: hypothetical protein VEC13_01260, partial [Candidatus Paceibacterota bacterium]|nr:hypothetical protein [Candidatus Paceibacterota bacterium]
MLIRKFLIAGGNKTALIQGEVARISPKLVKGFDQIGFIDTKDMPDLHMFGDELCINATLAFASILKKSGKLKTTGISKPVQFRNLKEKTEIKLEIPFKKKGKVVLFDGIGYILASKKEKKVFGKKEIKELCKKYGLPAFGGIVFEENYITPYVYVAKAGTFIKENSCGSGSIAFYIATGKSAVVQPTG